MHVLHVHARHLHEILPMSHQGTNLANRLLRAERRLQQADRVQVLKPLAIQHVRFSTGNMVHMLGIDQMDFDTPSLQNLEQRDPINAGGIPWPRYPRGIAAASRPTRTDPA